MILVNKMGQIKGTIASSQIISGSVDSEKEIEASIIPSGLTGLSAYELAVKNGYLGTEQQWLELHLKRDELKLVTQEEAKTDLEKS